MNEESSFNSKPSDYINRKALYAYIGIAIVVIIGITVLFVLNSRQPPKEYIAPQIVEELQMSDSQSNEKESQQSGSTIFQDADETTLSNIKSQYDKDFVENAPKEKNPFKATPFGIRPYNIEVEQLWKDTYTDGEWQTMVTSVLGSLENLWSDPLYKETIFDKSENDEKRVNKIRSLTYRDLVFSRIAPPSGVSVGDQMERDATPEDYQYYNAVVPIVDKDGKVPGTSFTPKSNNWKTGIADVKVGLPEGNSETIYANYPRFDIKRIVDYDGVYFIQNLSFYVQKDNTDEWKIVEVEYEEPIQQ